MKYYILNRDEVKKNIYVNPILVKTKSAAKITKLKKLIKQADKLLNEIKKELYDSNPINEERIELLLSIEKPLEITKQEYNSLLAMCLCDRQEQRIKICNKTEILKGDLYGNEIR